MKKLFFALALFCAFSISSAAQNYTIQQYLNIRSAVSPSLSPDGKRLAYLTNVTGTAQIWMIDLPAGAPKQITNYDDNVGFVRWSPAGNGLVFGKARGGDENTQLFWMSSDGANIKPLTDDQKVRHNFGEWSKDGKKIYYASNKRDRNWFDIYSMQIETGAAELLYQQDGSNSVAAVSDDGGKIIVSRSSVRFSLDNDLYLIDTKTKKQTHLTPHDEATQYGDVSFLPDGKTILLGTNFGHEYINLAQMNLKTGESGVKQGEIQFLDSENWELDASEVSGDGSLLAYTVNREGYSELYFRPLATGGDPHGKKSAAVKLPARGVVNNLVFSKDKTRLAFTFSASKYNTDIWLYDLKSKKLSQITKSDRAGIAQESFVEPQLIKFKSFDGREIPAWYYKPQAFQKHIEAEAAKFEKARKKRKNAQTKQQPAVWREEDITRLSSPSLYPVIVSVHGGPEGQERPGFNPLYQYYLSRGYAVLATNVRGSTGYGKTFSHLDDVEKREDSVKDLAYAVQWLKTAGGADAKRIAVMGGSYGGYMTMAAITLYPELWAAAVNTVGIVNWETFLKNTSGYRRRQREVEYGMLDKDIEFLRRISPIAKVDKIKTPLFVIHGRNDPRVPYTEAEQIVKVLKDRGATVEYKLFDDEGHGISKLKNRLELYPLVADFLDKYMK